MTKKTILITGASSGIGKETARFFQAKSWNVIATMRTPENETELTGLVNVLVARLDVQDTESISTAIAAGIERFGRIDVLLNNAGYGAYGALEATPKHKLRRQFDVNVIGLLETTKAVLPHFRKNQSGLIINISSIGGKITLPLGSLYHGTKFAVEGISEALRFEMETIGVKVKIVEPGAIKTDFVGRSFDFNNDESLTEYQPLVRKVLAAIEPLVDAGAEPVVVSEVIYRAATDGTNQLRYIAGDDAARWVAERKTLDDESMFAATKARFDL